jgi:hypothetical protein
MEQYQPPKKKKKLWKASDYLFNDPQKKEEFFEKITSVLEPARLKHCPRRSRQEYAERTVQQIINAMWVKVLEEMIFNARVFYFNNGKCSLRIARLPFTNNSSAWRIFLTPYYFMPFVSWKEGVRTHTTVRFKLNDKYKKMLLDQVGRGYNYRFGKPRYKRVERPVIYW